MKLCDIVFYLQNKVVFGAFDKMGSKCFVFKMFMYCVRSQSERIRTSIGLIHLPTFSSLTLMLCDSIYIQSA